MGPREAQAPGRTTRAAGLGQWPAEAQSAEARRCAPRLAAGPLASNRPLGVVLGRCEDPAAEMLELVRDTCNSY